MLPYLLRHYYRIESGLYQGTRMKAFNGKIKEIRGRLGWSQEELAHEVGVSLSTVQRWEQLGTKPSRLALRELERVLQREGISAGFRAG